jgi:hypothetical protein
MAAATISRVVHRWKVRGTQRFHVIGKDFDAAATVTLQDDRAVWADPVIEPGSDDKNLIFHSHPTHLNSGVIKSSGALTITITNPGTTPATTDVAGTYE